MLIYFVHHVASRINVDTVIDLVYADLRHAIATLTVDATQPDPPSGHPWRHGMPIAEPGGGYLQQLDEDGLADWAAERGGCGASADTDWRLRLPGRSGGHW